MSANDCCRVTARLRDGAVDATYVYEVEAEYADIQLWVWTEGNYSCDCNRSLFISWELPGYVDRDKCGDTIELVHLHIDYPDGRREWLLPEQAPK